MFLMPVRYKSQIFVCVHAYLVFVHLTWTPQIYRVLHFVFGEWKGDLYHKRVANQLFDLRKTSMKNTTVRLPIISDIVPVN